MVLYVHNIVLTKFNKELKSSCEIFTNLPRNEPKRGVAEEKEADAGVCGKRMGELLNGLMVKRLITPIECRKRWQGPSDR